MIVYRITAVFISFHILSSYIMSEGIEKKCINIEKKSINKTHSYSISTVY